MKVGRNSLFYVLTISIFIVLMWAILDSGKQLQPSGKNVEPYPSSFHTSVDGSVNDSPSATFDSIINIARKPLAILILQIIIILVLSRLFAYYSQKIKQPSVIGEILAGIVLGPSVLGAFSPDIFAFIFPQSSIEILHFLSQVGLILFMFIVGMELDVNVLKRSVGAAIMVSHASIVFPFALGVGLSYFLYPDFAPQHVSFLAFSLFIGTAMSITALPILARIIQERGLTRTKLGMLALTCGAIDDITAWGILAAVIAIVSSGSWINALVTFLLALAYILLMVFIIQPFLKKIGKVYIARETLSKQVVAVILIILLGSAFLTELIGIHALIGAFFAGIIMPKTPEFKKNVIEKIEDISLVLFMPLFFAFTGLRTEIGLLSQPNLWLVSLIVLTVAVTGKFAGTALAARFGGLSWEISLSLGTLMNTRGLIMLIVLNIGYDFGVISPEIFAIMVLMSLITTFMTGPILTFIQQIFSRKTKAESITTIHPFRILLAFGPPQMGSTLLNLSRALLPHENERLTPGQITAIHLTPSAEVHPTQAAIFEKEGFEPIKATADHYGIPLNTIYRATYDVQSEIVKTARQNKCDLLLLGSAKSVFTSNHLGGKIRKTLRRSPCNVGILIDHGFISARNIVVYYPEKQESFFRATIKNMIVNPDIQSITIADQNVFGQSSDIPVFDSEKVRITEAGIFDNSGKIMQTCDLVIVHIDDWKGEVVRKIMKSENPPSVLIIKS
jgi:Kef-type K+ transport system membrane component KefB